MLFFATQWRQINHGADIGSGVERASVVACLAEVDILLGARPTRVMRHSSRQVRSAACTRAPANITGFFDLDMGFEDPLLNFISLDLARGKRLA